MREKLQEHKDYDIVIAGDFNFPSIDWTHESGRNIPGKSGEEKTQIDKLLTLTDDFFLKQMIKQATRDDNILDLIFTNITNELYDCNITEIKTSSDHNLVEIQFNSDQHNQPDKTDHKNNGYHNEYQKFNFNKADFISINKDLNEINWSSELESKTIEEQLQTLNKNVLEIVAKYTSKKQTFSGKSYKSKFYKERRALWRRRKRLSKKRSVKSDEQLKEIELCIKQSHINERIHNEKIAIEKIVSNSKYFYSYANKSRNVREKIGPFINKETKVTISDPTEMAEMLQTQYCSVFSTPTEEIKNIDEFFSENPDEPYLSDINFDEEDIIKAIKQIKPHTAAGPDGFPALLLRKCCDTLSKPLYIIFRNSLDSGIVPNELKDAIITPIPKGGIKSDPKNYRPINLISKLLITLEKVICIKIVSFLESNNKMNSNQHGFRKLRSCLSQLIEHYDKVIEAVTEGKNVDVIYLDYSKAFDVVDHQILLRKLRENGITGKLGKWISNFIQNRNQVVSVNKHVSRKENVRSGVPQGSVLGPILFLVMISDIDKDIEISTVSSFADDSKVSHVISLKEDCEKLQETLNTIYEWSTENNMNFNELKFVALKYGENKEWTNCFEYKTPTGKVIAVEANTKDLGVIMSSDLKFKNHHIKTATKCRSLSAWILRTFITRESDTMTKLFNSLILPRIDYCSQLWAPHNVSDWNELEAIQRRFTHRITELKDLDYWSRIKRLRMYSIERRFERYRIIYLWKILENLAPNPNNKIVSKHSERRGRYVVIPNIKKQCSAKIITIRENSFTIHSAKLFNTLPKMIRNITDVRVETFKHHLDKLLRHIPDEPGIPGYAGRRAGASNSIYHQMSYYGGSESS